MRVVLIYIWSEIMEEKKHFKMYKSGKKWGIASIVFLNLTAVRGHQAKR